MRASAEFEAGYFSIQDHSAGLVTHLLGDNSGSTILDVCAAPGGKTSYLAERLGNKAAIYAYDSDEARVKRLEENIRRLGLDSVRVGRRDATVDEYPRADAVLLDVPCTGTGVMAKRADLRWRRKERDLKGMGSLQLGMLSHMSDRVSPGGMMVYATCSLEPEENWGVVDTFLRETPSFVLGSLQSKVLEKFTDERNALQTFPPDDGMDGVFAVILERTE